MRTFYVWDAHWNLGEEAGGQSGLWVEGLPGDLTLGALSTWKVFPVLRPAESREGECGS